MTSEHEQAREQVEGMARVWAEHINAAAVSFETDILPNLEHFAEAAQAASLAITEAVEFIQALEAAADLLPFPPTRWQRIKAHIKYFFWIENETDWIIVHVY